MSDPVADVAKVKKELEAILGILNDLNEAAATFAGLMGGGGHPSGGGGGGGLGLADVSVPGGGGMPPPMPAPFHPAHGGDSGGGGGVTPASAAVRLGTASVGAVAGIMPDTAAMVDMQQSLFQASFASGGHMGARDFDRLSSMAERTFGNMQTSVGSAQRSAAIASQFGFDPYGKAGQRMLGQVGAISLSTGMSNEEVSGIVFGQSTNPVMTNRLRMLGFEMFDAQGNPKDVAQVANHIIKMVYGASPSPEQITMGLRPGGALDLMLQSYIPDPGMQEVVKDSMRKQALNKGQYAANDAATAQRLGLFDNFLNPRTTGMRYQSTEGRKANAMRGSGVTGYNYGVDAASSLNDAFLSLAENVNAINAMLQFGAGAQGLMGGFLGTGPGAALSGFIAALTGGAHAGGGKVSGPGGPRDDKVPALLSNGEFVVQAEAVQKYGVQMFEALNAKRFADGGPTDLTISGHPALREGDPRLKTFTVAGGRSITVADWAGPMFQQFLQQWEDSPLLGNKGAGRLTLTEGPLDSWEDRPGMTTTDKTSDHAGYAVDIRYDVLEAPSGGVGQHFMSADEQAEVHRILGGLGGRLSWGGDYSKAIDEMHVYVSKGVDSASDSGPSTGGTTSQPGATGTISSGSPSVVVSRPAFVGTTVGVGLRGTSGKEQSILSAISNSAPYASLGVSQSNSTQSVGSAGTTATPGVASGDYGSGTITGANLVKLLHDTGFAGGDLRTAYGVVIGESGGDPKSVNHNTSGKYAGSADHGLFQMNDMTNKTAGAETVDYGPKIYEAAYNAHIGYLTRNDPKYSGWTDWNAYRDTTSEYSRGLKEYDDHPEWTKGYSKGAWRVDNDQIAQIHQNEMILPAPAAEAVRTVMREQRAGQSAAPARSGGGVVINLSVARASDDDATRVARKVVRMIEDERMLHAIGQGHP